MHSFWKLSLKRAFIIDSPLVPSLDATKDVNWKFHHRRSYRNYSTSKSPRRRETYNREKQAHCIDIRRCSIMCRRCRLNRSFRMHRHYMLASNHNQLCTSVQVGLVSMILRFAHKRSFKWGVIIILCVGVFIILCLVGNEVWRNHIRNHSVVGHELNWVTNLGNALL